VSLKEAAKLWREFLTKDQSLKDASVEHRRAAYDLASDWLSERDETPIDAAWASSVLNPVQYRYLQTDDNGDLCIASDEGVFYPETRGQLLTALRLMGVRT